MRIAIVHYHLKRGGVTRVIESTLNGFEQAESSPECVVLAGEVPADFRYKAQARSVEGLHYSNAQPETPDPGTLLKRMRQAARDVLGADPDLWHIHNHSLGKNSAMPGVVQELAEAGEAILLSLHDFAEDGRPENYRLIQGQADSAPFLYPAMDNVHYAFLNSRDFNLFKEAGIKKDHLHMMANPVEASPADHSGATASILESLRADRLFLYPVRAVRRKNFGEMLLWAALADEGDVFANTLGPTNQNFVDTYEDWKAFAENHALPVQFSIGENHDWSFEAIVQSAEAILSTSIAEGFGLAYLEPWLFGKAIAGRDLPDITADFKSKGIELEGLYASLPVPLDWIDPEPLKAAIKEGLKQAYEAYQRPLPADALDRAFQAICPGHDTIDFGGLNEALQQRVIEHLLADPKSAELLPRLEKNCPAERIQKNAAAIAQHYSLPHYASKLAGIYHSIPSGKSPAVDYIAPDTILDGFLKPERFRLLRT